jgi:hypothetical protein
VRNRQMIVALCAILVVAVAIQRHPTADIRVLTHDSSDPTPHQVKAALDLGLLGISVLYTWTARPLS